MILSAEYACATRLLVRVDEGSQISVIPTLDALPLWQAVKAAVAAGTLTIGDPPSDDASPAPAATPSP